MNREYHKWYSPTLNREMELLVFGHGGARMIVFPTSRARFFEYEDRGMVGALGDHIESGNLQLFCVDSVDAESFYARSVHPSGRIMRHLQYDQYLVRELLPFVWWRNPTPFTIVHGCSFGAYHAVNFALRHPELVNRAIALSGKYQMRGFFDGYYDDNIYYNNPSDFILNEQDPGRLDQIRKVDMIIAIGEHDPAYQNNREFSSALWRKNIWHAFRVWNGWSHDWPYWQQMIRWYVGGA